MRAARAARHVRRQARAALWRAAGCAHLNMLCAIATPACPRSHLAWACGSNRRTAPFGCDRITWVPRKPRQCNQRTDSGHSLAKKHQTWQHKQGLAWESDWQLVRTCGGKILGGGGGGGWEFMTSSRGTLQDAETRTTPFKFNLKFLSHETQPFNVEDRSWLLLSENNTSSTLKGAVSHNPLPINLGRQHSKLILKGLVRILTRASP